MHSFKDTAGREWSIDISVGTIKRVKALTGHWLTDLVTPGSSLVQLTTNDPTVIPDMLYAVIKPQADQAGVSDEQFGESLAGDAYWSGAYALQMAVVDFCPSPQQRAVTKKLLEKTEMAVRLAAEKALGALDKMTPSTLTRAKPRSSKSATSTPARSA